MAPFSVQRFLLKQCWCSFLQAQSEKQVLPLSDRHLRIFKYLYFRDLFFFFYKNRRFPHVVSRQHLAFCFVCFGSKSCIHSPSITRHNLRKFFELKEIIFLFYREEGRVPSFQVIQEYIKLVWCDSLPSFAVLYHLLLLIYYNSLSFFLCLSNSSGKKQRVSLLTVRTDKTRSARCLLPLLKIESSWKHTTKSSGPYFRLRNT